MNNSNPDLSQIPQLSTERWQQAHNQAIKSIRASVVAPDKQHYISQQSERAHGLLFYAMLFSVMGAAFWISAGKQIISAASLIDPLTSQARLSSGWGDWAIALTLAFGELGSLVFMIAVGNATSITKRRVFVSFALLCAAVALIANVSVTASHSNQEFVVFDWFMTILPPLTVLGVGLILEDDLMKSARQRARLEDAYQTALDEYERVQTNPEGASNFKAIWAKAVYDELIRYKKDRDLILPLSSEDKFELVNREYHTHMLWERYEVAPPRIEAPASKQRVNGASSAPELSVGGDGAVDAGDAPTPRQKAKELLDAHPEWANLSTRKLAEMTGISKDAFTRARRSENGRQ